MKLPAYPRTRPSGVEWLGDVPEHWETCLLKRAFRSVDYGISDSLESPGEVAILRMGNISNGKIVTDDLKYIDFVEPSLFLQRGDLLYNRTNSLDLIGKVGMFIGGDDSNVSFASYLVRLRTNDECLPEYFAYLLNTDGILGLARVNAFVSIGQCNLNPTRYGQIRISTPPLAEQRAIAAFLDRETGRVDRLVAKKRELIERLKEKRTALISRTVTRGLPPAAARAAGLPDNPPLKPSGIDWIGDIPKHWEVKKVKFVAKMESGHTPSRSEPSNWVDDECVIPWVSLNDTKHLKENDYISDTAVKISEEGMNNSSAHLLPAGVVVFTRDATIGLTAITTCPAAVSQHIIAWVPGPKITPKYLLLSFKAMQQYLESFTFGSTLKTIGMTDVRKLVTPIPPLPEQAAIAMYLDAETAKLDALVGKVEDAVERLQEYRTALITAAVTGKIDVRTTNQT